MITKFYEEYLDENNHPTQEREALSDIVAGIAEGFENIDKIETAITASEDAASEAAFIAGFKAAMQLIMEVRA